MSRPPTLSRTGRRGFGGTIVALADDVDDVDGTTIAAVDALLSPSDRRAAAEMPAHRLSPFLTGRLLLAELAAELSGTSADVMLRQISALCPRCGGPHGAPRVGALPASVSHADGVTVAALSPDGSVGIDVESVTEAPGRAQAIETVVRRGFADAISALEHWTAVEAVLKADGRGLEIDPSLVRTIPQHRSAPLWQVDDTAGTYAVQRLALRPGYLVALAGPASGTAPR